MLFAHSEIVHNFLQTSSPCSTGEAVPDCTIDVAFTWMRDILTTDLAAAPRIFLMEGVLLKQMH